MPSKGALMLSAADNVATAIEELAPGVAVPVRLNRETRTVAARERIPFGFKLALVAIPRGAPVIKYGEPIGVATADIAAGDLVHIHNLQGARGHGDAALADESPSMGGA